MHSSQLRTSSNSCATSGDQHDWRRSRRTSASARPRALPPAEDKNPRSGRLEMPALWPARSTPDPPPCPEEPVGRRLRREPHRPVQQLSQPLQRILKPLAVATCFQSDQRWRRQLPIETLGFSVPIAELTFLTSLVSVSRNAPCCQPGWRSHPEIFMEASPDPDGLGPQPKNIPASVRSLRPYPINLEERPNFR